PIALAAGEPSAWARGGAAAAAVAGMPHLGTLSVGTRGAGLADPGPAPLGGRSRGVGAAHGDSSALAAHAGGVQFAAAAPESATQPLHESSQGCPGTPAQARPVLRLVARWCGSGNGSPASGGRPGRPAAAAAPGGAGAGAAGPLGAHAAFLAAGVAHGADEGPRAGGPRAGAPRGGAAEGARQAVQAVRAPVATAGGAGVPARRAAPRRLLSAPLAPELPLAQRLGPVSRIFVALAIGATGPGDVSCDHLLGQSGPQTGAHALCLAREALCTDWAQARPEQDR
ncbi:unnamed protein product, partial [Prorocentrum cordatum]